MSVHTQIQCDGCCRIVSPDDRQALVWTKLSLHLQHGMSRVHRTFDLCPHCQDKVADAVIRPEALKVGYLVGVTP